MGAGIIPRRTDAGLLQSGGESPLGGQRSPLNTSHHLTGSCEGQRLKAQGVFAHFQWLRSFTSCDLGRGHLTFQWHCDFKCG